MLPKDNCAVGHPLTICSCFAVLNDSTCVQRPVVNVRCDRQEETKPQEQSCERLPDAHDGAISDHSAAGHDAVADEL